MTIQRWIKEQITLFESYKGSTINKVLIREMAIIERERNHLFEHPSCPFIQAHVIYLWLSGNRIIEIQTYQNDCEWGIFSSTLDSSLDLGTEIEEGSIFRFNSCTNFPVGTINLVSVFKSDNGDISEVKLVINDSEILLKSGEVYENPDGTISTKSNDESVLVFTDSQNVNLVEFNA